MMVSFNYRPLSVKGIVVSLNLIPFYIDDVCVYSLTVVHVIVITRSIYFNTYLSFADTRNILLDEFEDTDENKLSYTGIFQDYCSTIEAHLEKAVKQEIPVSKHTHTNHAVNWCTSCCIVVDVKCMYN